ncbi:hypothetical protein OYC64_011952 [Pagothenia borchgrevinki]|uniref:Uncharacterized protein n=1 Tax=Pagothenia borchgrevinki TaxID=8213 RepID=A0ABD2FH95_PAGBO
MSVSLAPHATAASCSRPATQTASCTLPRARSCMPERPWPTWDPARTGADVPLQCAVRTERPTARCVRRSMTALPWTTRAPATLWVLSLRVPRRLPAAGCPAPPSPPPHCTPLTPPGACCPICAAMLQILLNQEQINTFAKLNGSPVTVRGVLQVLRPLVSVPQCDVFGFLSIDKTLVVIIAPTEREPTSIQIEACNKEAEKIDSLINYASPTLISHVPLSAFLSSEVSTSSTYSSGGTPSSSLPPVLILLLGLLIAGIPPL